MKKELKTLKDLEFPAEYYKNYKTYNEGVIIDTEDLRSVAREWIKDLEYRKEVMGYTDCVEDCYESQILWIKHFFSLEDE